jgi:hemerythrin-like domain-containing protein
MPDPMTLLKADHREVKKLLEALGDSDEGTEREQMVEQLRSALTLHMQIEERLLYDLVEREVGPEDREEAEIEHGLARDGLDKVVQLVAAPGFGAAVEMLKAGIQHHVDEEEKEILPELKSDLERQEWMAIGDRIVQLKEQAGQRPPASASTRRSSRHTTARKT